MARTTHPTKSDSVTDLDFGGEVDLLSDAKPVAAEPLLWRTVIQAGRVVADAHVLTRVVLHLHK